MQALKLLVIGMGVVIAIATAALVTVIVHRAGQPGGGNATTVTAGSGVSDRPIVVPAGFRVVTTELSGDRLLVRLEGREPGGSSDEIRLLVLDLGRDNARRTLRLILPPAESGR
jgi:hypothetical protein